MGLHSITVRTCAVNTSPVVMVRLWNFICISSTTEWARNLAEIALVFKPNLVKYKPLGQHVDSTA